MQQNLPDSPQWIDDIEQNLPGFKFWLADTERLLNTKFTEIPNERAKPEYLKLLIMRLVYKL